MTAVGTLIALFVLAVMVLFAVRVVRSISGAHAVLREDLDHLERVLAQVADPGTLERDPDDITRRARYRGRDVQLTWLVPDPKLGPRTAHGNWSGTVVVVQLRDTGWGPLDPEVAAQLRGPAPHDFATVDDGWVVVGRRGWRPDRAQLTATLDRMLRSSAGARPT